MFIVQIYENCLKLSYFFLLLLYMIDIKYSTSTIKQYLLDNNIKSPKEYLNQYKAKTLPSNFPYGIISYLKRHDPENFISIDDLFPNRKSLKKKYPKKVYGNRLDYDEVVKLIRPLGMTTHAEWRDYINANKNNWDNRIPKTPKNHYSKLKKWISWKHFLIGENTREKMSHGEREIFRLLTNEGHFFEMNKRFDDLKGGRLSYDFYIPTFNQLIEYDGIYHFHRVYRKQEALDRQIKNDQLKQDYAANKKIRFKRIAYYEHNSIPLILHELGLITDPTLKLLRRSKNTKNFKPIPKNYKYHNTVGNFTYDQVDEIRKQYLLGYNRKDIESILNIKLNRFVFSEMVRNRTYFNSNYDPKNRIVLPKPQKPLPLKKIDPILYNELVLLKQEREDALIKYVNPKLDEIKILRDKIFQLESDKRKLPKISKIKKITVVDIKINNENFKVFGQYKHYGRYSYENFIYLNKHTAGEIICNIHGTFFQTLKNHLSISRGSQCPKCAIANKNNPLPWRDIRELKTYEKKDKVIRRVNLEMMSEINKSINDISNEILNIKQEISNLLKPIDERIIEIKMIIYPTYKPPTTSIKKIKNKGYTITIYDKSPQPKYPLLEGKNGVAKLVYEDIVYILENPNLGSKKLGAYFSIDESVIRRIRKGRAYKKFINQYFETRKNLPEKFLKTES